MQNYFQYIATTFPFQIIVNTSMIQKKYTEQS